MKATFDFVPHIVELDSTEANTVNGGVGFAHDVGTALRFAWVCLTSGGPIHGQPAAALDYAVNKVKCGC